MSGGEKHGAGRVLLWAGSTASGSAALKKVNGIKKMEENLQILEKNLKSSAEDQLPNTHQKW